MIVSVIHGLMINFRSLFYRIFRKRKYQAHAWIEEMEFTLFYDYDQIKDSKLSQLTDKGKIDWFHLRMEAVFLEPLRRIFNLKSMAHRELNSRSTYDRPIRAIMIAIFSVLLNGIEALGSFLENSTKAENFYAFMKKYMSDWNIHVSGTSYPTDCLLRILWKYFRNGIAHGFVIEGGGGIERLNGDEKLKIENGRLEICPTAFFKDFEIGVKAFFADMEDPNSSERLSFLSRFQQLYPC